MGAGVTEAGFFTDFAACGGGRWYGWRRGTSSRTGCISRTGLTGTRRGHPGGELALTDVPEWAGLEPEVVIRGVDRPLFGELRMPMANTVDETSKLPVSLYARAVDTMVELDRIYSEFLWEIHTGKRKRIVDRTASSRTRAAVGCPSRTRPRTFTCPWI